MSDPRFDRQFTVNGTTHIIRYTNRAIALAEQLMDCDFYEVAMKFGSGRFGVSDLARGLCAGLEGGRRRHNIARDPWTVDEVYDLLDDYDGSFADLGLLVIEALDAAMRKLDPSLYAEAAQALDGEKVDPPEAAGPGTGRSKPQPEPVSVSSGI
jgi:hypothetical protein